MANKPSILVLGTTKNQVELIKTIKARNFNVIAIGNGSDYAIRGIADETIRLNTADKAAVLSLARDKEVSAIITCGTSTAICTIAWVNERFSQKPTIIDYATALDATSKDRLRAKLEPDGLVLPGKACKNISEIVEAAKDIPGSVMLKPANGGGGKGIILDRKKNKESLFAALNECKKFAGDDDIIVEQFASGIVLGVESIILDGEIFILAIPEKTVTGKSNSVTTGVHFPSQRLRKFEKIIAEANKNTIERLGIKWGPTHIDMILNPKTGKIHVIDVGARLVGGDLGWALIPDSSGYDIYGATLDLALGKIPEKPSLSKNYSNMIYASHFYTTKQSGRLKNIKVGQVDLGEKGKCCGWEILKRDGDLIGSTENDSDRLVSFHFTAKNEEELSQKITKANNSVFFELYS